MVPTNNPSLYREYILSYAKIQNAAAPGIAAKRPKRRPLDNNISYSNSLSHLAQHHFRSCAAGNAGRRAKPRSMWNSGLGIDESTRRPSGGRGGEGGLENSLQKRYITM
jgi:hypothetical protein